MRKIVAILLSLLFVADGARGQEPSWLSDARELIERGRTNAKADALGEVTREYSLADLDFDSVFEVLETVSYYEGAPGFLNIEIEPVFDWINVYRHTPAGYVESTAKFRNFIEGRLAFYEMWQKLLRSPNALSEDSVGLVANNQKEFEDVLSSYVTKAKELLQ